MINSVCESPEVWTEVNQPEHADGLKRCTRCFEPLPIDMFRFRRRRENQRHSVCRECNRIAELDRRRRKRHKGFFRDISDLRYANSAEALAAAVEILIHKYGGLERFTRQWWDAVEAAQQDKRTSSVLRAFTAILRMMQAAEELAAEAAPSLESLSDEELSERRTEAILEIVRCNPQIAVEAAGRIGWQVIPPASSMGTDVPEDSLSGV